jgi:hypothetical protein
VLLFVASLFVMARWPQAFVPERLGDISAKAALFFGVVAFIVGYCRRPKHKMSKSSPPTSENLHPIDYASLAHILDDQKRKSDKNPPA